MAMSTLVDHGPSARLGSLLGYKTEEEFRTVFENNYVLSSTVTNNNVVPKQYEITIGKPHDDTPSTPKDVS
jgi:hypothetical protein